MSDGDPHPDGNSDGDQPDVVPPASQAPGEPQTPADGSSPPPAVAPEDDSLQQALQRHALELPSEHLAPVTSYAELLWEWNEKLNLTRHTTWDLFVGRDLRDTLQLAQLLKPGEEVLDVGSGGGVPGMLLSVLRPDLDITLSESMAKKARVLQDMAQRLQLPVSLHHGRAEDLLEDFRYHSIVARAVGPLWKICKWFQPHWPSIGRLLLIKGPNWVAERSEARHRQLLADLELRCVASYSTPGADGESVVLQLWPRGLDPP